MSKPTQSAQPDPLAQIADALVADIQALLKKPQPLASLADLSAALPEAQAVSAARTLVSSAQQRITDMSREQEARQQTLVKAIEEDLNVQIARLKATDTRPIPQPQKDHYIVFGRVTDRKSGLGLPNVVLRIFDLDRKQDDLLGSAQTDDDGYYRLEYPAQAIADERDRKAEIYIQVLDETGAIVHQTPRSFFEKAGPVHELDIVIDGAKLPANMELARAIAAKRQRELEWYEAQRRMLQANVSRKS